MKNKIKIPKFKSEEKERDFWAKINLNKHFKPEDFEHVSFPNLKASSHSISIRIPDYLLIRLKEKANELDIPYQSLMKKYIADSVLS